MKREELLGTVRWVTDQIRDARRNDPEVAHAWAGFAAELLEAYHRQKEEEGPPWEGTIRTLHGQGLSVKDMADASGWCEGTIRNRLSALGLKCNRNV